MSTDIKNSKSQRIKWIITILCTIIVYFIPTNDVYTKQISLFFTITLFGLFLMAFEFFEPMVISILMPMAWVAVGVTDAAGAMSGFTSTIVPMLAGAYFLANALSESGLLKRVALIVIKKCGGSWTGLLFGVFLAGVVISILTFSMGYIILATLCVGIIKSLDIKMASKESAMIGFACLLGVCSSRTFIYAPASYAIVIAQGRLIEPTFDVTPIHAFTHNIPMFIISCVMLWLINKIWRTNLSLQSKEYFQNELDKLGKMAAKEKKSVIFMIFFFALLISSTFIGMDANLLFALAPWILLLPGINVASSKSIQEMNWQNLFFIAACMSIGTVAASLGIGNLIANLSAPLLGRFGTVGFFVVLFAIVFVLNLFMTPSAIWGVITAPMCEIAVSLGIGIRPVCYALVMCSEAVVFPYEYVPYLIVFSFGMMSMTDFIKLNALKCVFSLIGFVCLILPYWTFIGVL